MFLENRRLEINKIDEEIVNLLIKRNKLSAEVIKFKKDNNLGVYDKSRESAIIQSLKDKFSGKINPCEIEKLYSDILFFSKHEHLNLMFDNQLGSFFKEKPIFVAGPCSVESEEQIHRIAKDLSSFGIKYLRGGAFKPRTAPDSFQGLGSIGIKYLKEAAELNDMKVVTEVMSAQQLYENYSLIDVIQIGSKNMFSYQLLKDIAEINKKENKPIILKRHFNATLKEFIYAADYLQTEHQNNIILCLRGIRTYEQIDSKLRFTPDLASIIELKRLTNLPIIFDPSHSAGDAEYVFELSKGALAMGADGLIIETHYNPAESIVDAKQTIDYTTLKMIFSFIEQIRYAVE